MSRRILVVDDDEGMVSTLADILALRGWQPLKAFDGRTAVKMVASHDDVDLVLMDVRMDRGSGVDALRSIRKSGSPVKVILMSALATKELLAEAVGAGALTLLRKPLDLPGLLRMLDAAVTA